MKTHYYIIIVQKKKKKKKKKKKLKLKGGLKTGAIMTNDP